MVCIVTVASTAGRAPPPADLVDERWGALEDLPVELASADVVLCATAADEPVLGVGLVSAATGGRPIVAVDLSVPRNIDPAVGCLDGVALLDMDELTRFAERGLAERRAELPAVQRIVDEELERYRAASSARSVAPIVAALRQRADEVVAHEADRLDARLAALAPADREVAEQFVRGVVAKLLHEPTVRLKDAAGTLRGERLGGSLRELFDL